MGFLFDVFTNLLTLAVFIYALWCAAMYRTLCRPAIWKWVEEQEKLKVTGPRFWLIYFSEPGPNYPGYDYFVPNILWVMIKEVIYWMLRKENRPTYKGWMKIRNGSTYTVHVTCYPKSGRWMPATELTLPPRKTAWVQVECDEQGLFIAHDTKP